MAGFCCTSNTTNTMIPKKNKLSAMVMEKRDPSEHPLPENLNEGQTGTNTLDMDKLKKIVVVLKKKHEVTQQALQEFQEENTILKGQQNLLKQLLEQAHRDHEKTRSEFDKVRVSLSEQEYDHEAPQKLEQALLDIKSSQAALRATQLDLEAAKELLEAEKVSAELQKNRLEKLALAIKERDKRIAELQQYESSYRRALDHKLQLDSALEEELYAKHSIVEEKERLLNEIAEGRQHSEQLQRVIQYLRERQEEATLENQQLQEEYLRSQETLKTLQQQLETTHSSLEQAKHETEEAKQHQKFAENELHSLQEQFKQLKNRTIIVQHELQKRESSLIASNNIIDQFKFDKQNLQRELLEARQTSQTLSENLSATQSALSALQKLADEQYETITHLNEQGEAWQRHNTTLENSLTENRETIEFLQKSLQEAHEWRHSAEGRLSSYEQETSNYANVNSELEQRSQEYQTQIHTLQGHIDNITNELSEAQGLLSSLKDTEEKYGFLDERYGALNDQLRISFSNIKVHEKREEQYQELIQARENQLVSAQQELEELKVRYAQLEENLRQSEHTHLEKENALKLSHHHLAKKVKECTLLSEKNKELDSSFNDLQQTLTKTCAQVDELNNKLEEQRIAYRKQDDQNLEARKQSEEYSRNWEKKYFEMFEQAQNSDRRTQSIQNRLQEAERQLEKYYQLEALLKNLGITQAQHEAQLPPPPPNPTEPPAPRFDKPVSAEPPPTTTPPLKQEMLFENQNHNYKRKEHLFD